MKKTVALLVTMLMVVSSLTLFAETREISGTVVDAKTGAPLINANVIIQGEMAGAATNVDGKFSFTFDVKGNITLVVNYMGYKKKVINLTPSSRMVNLAIEMEPDIFQGEQVVVTGIASKRSKSRSEVAVSRVNAVKYTEETSYDNISSLLNGKVAGVQVKSVSGNVGGGIRFDMRSGAGLNGDGQPLVIVDGVRISNASITGWDVGGQDMSALADLNPDDIESIDILKGPAGAASYGTDGSNGVIIITTKRGKTGTGTGKPVAITYKSVFGYNTQSYKYTEDDFVSYKDINAVFRNGAIRENSISAYGGGNFVKYYVALSSRGEDGLMYNNTFKRTSLRANIDAYPSEKLTLSASTNFVLGENQRPNNDNNIFGFLGNTILLPIPYLFTDSASVFGLETVARNNRFVGGLNVQYKPIKNLEINGKAGLDDSDIRDDKTYPTNLYYSFYPAGSRNIWNRMYRRFNFEANASYNYEPVKGLKINSIIGVQAIDTKWRTFYIQKKDFLTELVTNIGAGATLEDADEGFGHSRQAGIFTSHQFAYNDQYFATFMLRKDYASSIGEKAPSIYYPSASVAVRLDKYAFFPKFFSIMKLRASYGESGQLPGTVAGIPLLWQAEQSGWGAGATLANIGNEKIEPERVKEYEVGFDAEFLDNYSVEFSYYRQVAQNSIISFRNAPSTGLTASSVPFNVGEAKGWGLEALLNGRPVNLRNFTVDFTLTSSWQDNEVVDLGGAQPIFDGFDLNVFKEGLPKYAFYTYKVNGALFNEDGTYAGPDVDTERSYIGTPIPKYKGSFSLDFKIFKRLKIRALCDWAMGQSVFNNTRVFAIYLGEAYGFGANDKRYLQLKDMLGYADNYEDIDALQPGTDAYKDAANEFAKLDHRWDANFVEPADFFKLREVSVSYGITGLLKKIYGNLPISDLTIGASGMNLFTITKYSGADPEVNSDGSRGMSRGQDFLTLMHPKVYNVWLKITL